MHLILLYWEYMRYIYHKDLCSFIVKIYLTVRKEQLMLLQLFFISSLHTQCHAFIFVFM